MTFIDTFVSAIGEKRDDDTDAVALVLKAIDATNECQWALQACGAPARQIDIAHLLVDQAELRLFRTPSRSISDVVLKIATLRAWTEFLNPAADHLSVHIKADIANLGFSDAEVAAAVAKSKPESVDDFEHQSERPATTTTTIFRSETERCRA